MCPTLRAFTTIEELFDLKEKWNELVYHNCKTPYFLFGFIEQFFQSKARNGRHEKPLLLVYFVGEEIVGIVPFVVHSWKGMFRVANFLTGYDFDPDFVVKEGYREDFLYQVIDFLFKRVDCNFISLSLPSKTESFEVLLRGSKSLGTHSMVHLVAGHSVVLVTMSWSEFEKERGRNFRKFFRRIERRMGLIGDWKIVLARKDHSEIEIYKDILEIEKSSWKQQYRTNIGLTADQLLLELWTSAINSSGEAGFSWDVAFLELDGKKIAYSFWLEYKDTAFICKTSFDDNYRTYYPGVYINNAVIHELFNNPTIKEIDLMTDLPFHYRWKPKLVPRSVCQISKSRILMAFFKVFYSRYFLGVRQIIHRLVSVS